MKLLRGVWTFVDRRTRRRIVVSGAASMALALLDTVAVLLVFPLVQLLVSPDQHTVTLPFGGEIGGTELQAAGVLAAVVVSLFLVKSALGIVFLRWNLGFVLDAETEAAGRLFSGRLDAADRSADPRDTAALQRTLSDSLRKVFPEGLAFVLPAFADQLVIVLLALLVVLIAPLEALVAVATFGTAALGYRWAIHGRTNRASTALHREQRRSIALSGESLRAAREIALSGTSEHFARRYVELRGLVARSQRVIALNEQLPRSFLEVCLLVCTAAVAAVAFSHHDTATALALVGTFAAVGFRVLPSINRVLLATARARAARPSLEQIRADLADGDAARGLSVEPRDPVRRVVVRDLTVTYAERAEPVLRDVQLELRSGEIVGVLGSSGAGKTSLVNALLGFVPVARGAVLIDGTTPVTGPASWGGRAAYVPQEVVVFDTSLRENVAFGAESALIDDARVTEALDGVHLGHLVHELPAGLDTELGEGGARLSGGQRQRLGIARALYLDADLLVLDESTAGLDFATEQHVLATLAELREGRILVLVSHHRAVMEFCDRLLVLRAGRLAGSGDLDELADVLRRSGLSAAGDRPALPASSR